MTLTSIEALSLDQTRRKKILDMNNLYDAVVALGRCWGHLRNAGWDTARSNFIAAVTRELSNYIDII